MNYGYFLIQQKIPFIFPILLGLVYNLAIADQTQESGDNLDWKVKFCNETKLYNVHCGTVKENCSKYYFFYRSFPEDWRLRTQEENCEAMFENCIKESFDNCMIYHKP